jgi:hypothetical protein
MGFWRAYPKRKDWRKPSRKVSNGCRPGGECEWCRAGRLHGSTKRELSAREQINEYFQSIGVQHVG